MKICVTGGAGFIGTNFVRYLLEAYECKLTVIDKLTYAGKKENLDGLDIKFIQKDICDLTEKDFDDFDFVFHFAAASHVDRSIYEPREFLMSNVFGTVNLLDLCRKLGVGRFVFVGTDEAYGSVSKPSREDDKIDPSSPYSASKVSAETFCNAYYKTFNVPVIITRSSNNFGPYQHEEKFISKTIINTLKRKKIPIYGTGENIRDWIFVRDNCEGIDFISRNGLVGETYNIGGGNQISNIDMVHKILSLIGASTDLITFVDDRLGHDFEYNLDCWKAHKLGWKPYFNLDDALIKTIEWYKKCLK